MSYVPGTQRPVSGPWTTGCPTGAYLASTTSRATAAPTAWTACRATAPPSGWRASRATAASGTSLAPPRLFCASQETGSTGSWRRTGLQPELARTRPEGRMTFLFSFLSKVKECEEPNEEERVWIDALTRPLSFTPPPADPKSEAYSSRLQTRRGCDAPDGRQPTLEDKRRGFAQSRSEQNVTLTLKRCTELCFNLLEPFVLRTEPVASILSSSFVLRTLEGNHISPLQTASICRNKFVTFKIYIKAKI